MMKNDEKIIRKWWKMMKKLLENDEKYINMHNLRKWLELEMEMEMKMKVTNIYKHEKLILVLKIEIE